MGPGVRNGGAARPRRSGIRALWALLALMGCGSEPPGSSLGDDEPDDQGDDGTGDDGSDDDPGDDPDDDGDPECDPGFEVRDGECADIDECAGSDAPCAGGTCTNSPGGYECSCPPGYQASEDGASCVSLCTIETDLCQNGFTCVNEADGTACAFQVANVSVGYTHACLLTPSGLAYCWGSNDRGQLGTGDTERHPRPRAVHVPEGVSFVQIHAYHDQSCGRTESGEVYCWGIAYPDDWLEPGLVDLDLYHDVSAALTLGEGDLSILSDDGRPYAIFKEDGLRIPNGLTEEELPRLSSLSTDAGSSCGIARTGETLCWGNDDYGQLGDGPTDSHGGPPVEPVPPFEGAHFVQVDAIGSTFCAVEAGGSIYCWGDNEFGVLGSAGGNQSTPQPIELDGNPGFVSVSGGTSSTCGLTGDGLAYCWGAGFNGLLGDGESYEVGDEMLPTPVLMPEGVHFTAISVGSLQVCALDETKQLYCWGNETRFEGEGFGSSDAPVPFLEPE